MASPLSERDYAQWVRALREKRPKGAIEIAAEKCKALRDALAAESLAYMFGMPVIASEHVPKGEAIVIGFDPASRDPLPTAFVAKGIDPSASCLVSGPPPKFRHIDPSRMGRPFSFQEDHP